MNGQFTRGEPTHKMGPSVTDWIEWFEKRPVHHYFSLNCVVSNRELFVIIISATKGATLVEAEGKVPAGIVFTNEVMNSGKYEQVGKAKGNLKWGEHAELLEQIPEIRERYEKNLEFMNVRLANDNKTEYYRGTLDANEASTTVKLISNRVLGNFATARLWSSKNDGWLCCSGKPKVD